MTQRAKLSTGSLARLEEIIRALRDPVSGCPWDKVQTHDSLIRYCLEEAYEVVSSIIRKDEQNLKEELGDLLLQVLLHAQIASETGKFDLNDVMESLAEKLVFRHPHVFEDQNADSPEESLKIWEKRKKMGKKAVKSAEEGLNSDFKDEMPYPATLKTQKMLAEAHKMGFRWPSAALALAKVKEEIAELEEVLGENDAATAMEFADLMMAVTDLGLYLKLDAETSLLKASHKFQQRFQQMLALAEEQNTDFSSLSLSQMLDLWTRAKAYSSIKAPLVKKG